MKIVKRYEIRTVRNGDVFTSPTNYRLYERTRALRIVKRLKRCGVDALAAPIRIAGFES